MEDQDFLGFIHKVKVKTGIDLSLYKEAQMKRRLTSLREKRNFDSFHSYFEAIQRDSSLFTEFLDKMTINVSEFFRNPNRWDVLEQKILPRLLRENNRIKVWSAACSTGEEPYSLALLLTKFKRLSEIRVVATDLDDNALRKAKEGIYVERSLQNVADEFIKQYFEQDGIQYRISSALKERVVFAKQNLLSDPFEGQFDLILCRNVMIYFTEEAKDQLYHKFSQALRPGGVLFVGSTEQIFHPEKYGFQSEDTFFYRKKA